MVFPKAVDGFSEMSMSDNRLPVHTLSVFSLS